MMFKKFRKYLIVLMAVVMVASFAVIPTSAVIVSSYQTWVDYSYGYYGRYVYAYGDSTEPYWLKANVTNKYNQLYMSSFTYTNIRGPLDADVYGPWYEAKSDANACRGYDTHGTWPM